MELIISFLGELFAKILPAWVIFSLAAVGMGFLTWLLKKQMPGRKGILFAIVSGVCAAIVTAYAILLWSNAIYLEANLAPSVRVKAEPNIVDIGTTS